MTDQYYTPKEVAELLRVDKQTILRYIKDGKMKAIRLGHNTYRIPVTEIEYLLKKGDKPND